MIRITFRDDDDVFETLLLEDREDVGPEIRQLRAADCDAGPSQPVDVEVGHCPACLSDENDPVGELLGLSREEHRILMRWRTRKEDGVSSGELGRILDKLCRVLDRPRLCDRETKRIVVQVDPTP
jgi:hypothetical protein